MKKAEFLIVGLTAGLLLTALASSSTYVLTISPVPGNGTVIGKDASNATIINCSTIASNCSANVTANTSVTLQAIPNSGYRLAGWTGNCSGCGANTTCAINMTSNMTCSANFTPTSSGGSGGGGGGGGCSMTGSASSMAGLWNILVWLSVPVFALVRRIRKK
jgi:hypothetical protein